MVLKSCQRVARWTSTERGQGADGGGGWWPRLPPHGAAGEVVASLEASLTMSLEREVQAHDW